MTEKVTNEMLATEIRSLADQQLRFHAENREDHGKIFEKQNDQGERIKACETEISNIKPKVKMTKRVVNETANKQAGLAGQWKVLLYFLGAGGVGILGWLLKGAFG